MTAAQPVDSETTIDFSKFTQLQKLAGLLLILDGPNAAQIMGKLEEQELEEVSSEMIKFAPITQELQQEILAEFSDVAVEASTAISGGVERVKEMLEKSVGLFRASDIICRVSPMRAPVTAMQPIVELDARHIFSLVQHEQMQTIALVASYLPPEKAAQLLSLIRPEIREQVVERLATLAPTSIEVVEGVAEELHRKLASNRTRGLSQTGGIKAAAQLLNALPKNISDPVLMSLKERNSDLGEAVFKKMFTFDELERMTPQMLQKIMQEVDFRMLAVALKTANEGLKKAIFTALSKRAAENVRDEIAFLGPLKLNEIDSAQSQIIGIVKRLESEGELDLDEMRQASK